MAWYHPALFALDAERAHSLTIAALAAWGKIGAPFAPAVDYPSLRTTVAGIDFANPIGLAAGVDKDARAIPAWHALGFGGVEVGTLTPRPQAGNPRPRIFRLPEDRAIINRLGFNNGGMRRGLARVEDWRAGTRARGNVLGINVGANKDSKDRLADYIWAVRAAAKHADYVTINISSPNTPGLRDLQHGAALIDLLNACRDAASKTALFLKVAPDLDRPAIDDIARAALSTRLDALVIANTTVSRPALCSRNAEETGGLSGAPLAALARSALTTFREATSRAIPLISVGGIDSAAEAYARIRAGASLVQLYTALVYEGAGLPRRIADDLARLLARDGFASVAEAVGVDG